MKQLPVLRSSRARPCLGHVPCRLLRTLGIAMFFATSGSFAVIAQTTSGSSDRGARIAEAKCAACHGVDGNSPDTRYPKLAGQNPAYLYAQLWAFKTGARRSEEMLGIVAALSDADMADAASFFARQAIRPDPIKDKDLASIGQSIYFAGAGPGMTPPCAMCHGSAGQRGMPRTMGCMPMMGMMGPRMMGRGMMGMMANAPDLKGQHATYIIDQLNRFAAGQRWGMMMNRIAAAMTETDKKAVAEFLSGLQ